MSNDKALTEVYRRIEELRAEITELKTNATQPPAAEPEQLDEVTDVDDLQGWVDNTLCPMLTEIVHPSDYPAFCTEWHRHPLALFLFETAYLSWCEIEDTAGRMKWMGEALLPIRSVVSAPDGPFTLCKQQHHSRAMHDDLLTDGGPHRPEVDREGTNPIAIIADTDNPPANNAAHTPFTAALEPVATAQSSTARLDDLGV